MGKTVILGATGRVAGLAADILSQTSPGSLRLTSSREAGLAGLRARYPDADVVQADWNDRASLEAAMQGATRLLVITPDSTIDENLVTPNIIAAAKAVGSIELLVRMLANRPGFTPDDVSPEYLATRIGAAHHVIAWPLLEASGLPIAYVNIPAWFMLNLSMFVATEVQSKRRIALPAETDASRMWVSEYDVAAVMAAVLAGPPSQHVRQEYVLTSATHYTYADVARTFSDSIGAPVAYVDDDTMLRETFGDTFDTLMTYLRDDSPYQGVPHRETVSQLLGRPQQTLGDYITAHLQDYK